MNWLIEQRAQQKSELARWLEETSWQIFGTLKFTNGQDISEQRAFADLRRFFNQLDKLYMGDKMVEAGHRIERAVFKQFGSSGENLHYHFVARPNANPHQFCVTARCIWEETSRFTMGYENTWISEVQDSNSAVHYCLHEYMALGADTLCLSTTHRSEEHPMPKPIHRLRRLLRRQLRNEQTSETALTRAALNARKKRIAGATATH